LKSHRFLLRVKLFLFISNIMGANAIEFIVKEKRERKGKISKETVK
jgi:hypothetical protein